MCLHFLNFWGFLTQKIETKKTIKNSELELNFLIVVLLTNIVEKKNKPNKNKKYLLINNWVSDNPPIFYRFSHETQSVAGLLDWTID